MPTKNTTSLTSVHSRFPSLSTWNGPTSWKYPHKPSPTWTGSFSTTSRPSFSNSPMSTLKTLRKALSSNLPKTLPSNHLLRLSLTPSTYSIFSTLINLPFSWESPNYQCHCWMSLFRARPWSNCSTSQLPLILTLTTWPPSIGTCWSEDGSPFCKKCAQLRI